MGTKNNPGAYDCYANAEPDEPMFVLLGRDRDAPLLVDMWARKSEARGEDPAKVAEARKCALDMRAYQTAIAATKPQRALGGTCSCPATSEYDPPCDRHGVLGIGVVGSG